MSGISSGGFSTISTLQLTEPDYVKPRTVKSESTWVPGEAIDPSKMAPGKTYVSLLTECCVRRSVVPIAQLVGDAGGESDLDDQLSTGPNFTYIYEVDGIHSTGRGKNKKTAKHLAAKRILEQIVDNGCHLDWAIPGRSQEEARLYINNLMPELNESVFGTINDKDKDTFPESTINPFDNPIGRLNEKCVKAKMNQPIFELVEEIGQPNDKIFTITCRVGLNFVTNGEGRNKKIAKRIASINMLKILEALPQEELLISDTIDPTTVTSDHPRCNDDDSTIRFSPQSVSINTCSPLEIAVSNTKYAVELNQWNSLSKPCSENRHLLQNVVSEMTGRSTEVIVFRGLKRANAHGNYQCLAQLGLNPMAVCYGTGASKEEAECAASHSALHYLKTMSNSLLPLKPEQ